MGAEKTSPWVLEQLYSIVNARYEDGRAIMVTTNLDHEALREQIGPRTVSRLIEMCGDSLPMFGTDHRVEADLPTFDAPAPPSAAAERALRYGEQAPPPAALRGGFE